jgi:tetratricopeptide (TPR) repeat protein
MNGDSTSMNLSATKGSRDTKSLFRANSKLVKNGIAHPEVVFENSVILANKKFSGLGDDSWTALEQLVLSAIRLGNETWIGYGLKSLRDRFPGSSRVQKLVGLYRESKEDWSEAESIYKEMLQANPTDLYPRKRLIACLKAQGRTRDTMQAIIDQLEVFSSDPELWHELTMMYIRQCAFSRAVFSFEEVLLSNPTSFYNLLVYAELLASSGDWALSRKYFCKALRYRPDQVRALWGLLNCLVSAEMKETKTHAALLAETKRRLLNVYEPIDNNASRAAIRMINSM